jgi:hypothetical protein
VSRFLAWASYWIRPYDMIGDRRRWVWQPRMRCGFGNLTAADAEALTEAARAFHKAAQAALRRAADNDPATP